MRGVFVDLVVAVRVLRRQASAGAGELDLPAKAVPGRQVPVQERVARAAVTGLRCRDGAERTWGWTAVLVSGTERVARAAVTGLRCRDGAERTWGWTAVLVSGTERVARAAVTGLRCRDGAERTWGWTAVLQSCNIYRRGNVAQWLESQN